MSNMVSDYRYYLIVLFFTTSCTHSFIPKEIKVLYKDHEIALDIINTKIIKNYPNIELTSINYRLIRPIIDSIKVIEISEVDTVINYYLKEKYHPKNATAIYTYNTRIYSSSLKANYWSYERLAKNWYLAIYMNGPAW